MFDLPELVRKTYKGAVAVSAGPSKHRWFVVFAALPANLTNNGLTRAGLALPSLRRLSESEVIGYGLTGEVVVYAA